MIKVANKRPGGSIYHYGHFIMDCLFPEIMIGIQRQKKVVRVKNLHETIGNLDKKYEEIMRVKNVELPPQKYNKIKGPVRKIKRILYPSYNQVKFYRNYVFNRYRINPEQVDRKYPKVILIKRGWKPLLEGKGFQRKARNTGKVRREIFNIGQLEIWLKKKYGNLFKAVVLEDMPYKKQIKHFNNAKMIIGIHGAALANMLYCKRGAKLIEVLDKRIWDWQFVNTSMMMLGVTRVTCKNNINIIKRTIKGNSNVNK